LRVFAISPYTTLFRSGGDVLAAEPDEAAVEIHVEVAGKGDEPVDVIGRHAGPDRGQAHEAVERPGVEVVPAERPGDALGHRPLAGGGRAVDGDDGSGRPGAHGVPVPASAMPRPAPAAIGTKPGNEVATFSVSPIEMAPAARIAAIANDIAIRWSPFASTRPPEKAAPSGRPSISMPSAVGSAATPRARRPSAMLAIRSDSLTRSSAAPLTRVRPRAQAAATKIAGNSSIASGTSDSGTSMPRSSAERTRRSATGSPPTSASASTVMSAPISRRTS